MTAPPNALASTLRAFFGEHLPTIRGVSPHTIRSYRDSTVLLLRFLARTTHRPVAALDVPDLTVEHIVAFLHHLEQERHVTATTRNVRLAAIHAFARFLAAQEPTHLDPAQRLLGIPFKRARSRPIAYLEYEEIAAVLDGVDRSTRAGRRDYTLLATMFNTGARVQEILDLRASDLQLTKPYQVRLVGKWRKVRWCPLWPQTAQLVRAWCLERPLDLRSDAPVFINQRGRPLTRFGVRFILAKHFRRAAQHVPHLRTKRLHPHSLRHSTAVHLLKSGVDLTTIAHLRRSSETPGVCLSEVTRWVASTGGRGLRQAVPSEREGLWKVWTSKGRCPHLPQARRRLQEALRMRRGGSLYRSTNGQILVSVEAPPHWLGHASVNTTNRYVTVDLDLKRKALARAAPLGRSRSSRAPWRRDPSVLAWLEAL